MGFEWDEVKNETNILKHAIDFQDAKKVFNKPLVIRLDERKDYGENRWIGLGKMEDTIVTVVYTKRGKNTRIISIRKADKKERKIYRERIE